MPVLPQIRNVWRAVAKRTAGYSGIQLQVLQATENSPTTGPAFIKLTKRYELAQISWDDDAFDQMEMIFTLRLTNKRKWRRVVKALILLHHCLHHGSSKFTIYCERNRDLLRSLHETYPFTWEDHRDCGIEVRREARKVLALLDNPNFPQIRCNAFDAHLQRGQVRQDVSPPLRRRGALFRLRSGERLKTTLPEHTDESLPWLLNPITIKHKVRLAVSDFVNMDRAMEDIKDIAETMTCPEDFTEIMEAILECLVSDGNQRDWGQVLRALILLRECLSNVSADLANHFEGNGSVTHMSNGFQDLGDFDFSHHTVATQSATGPEDYDVARLTENAFLTQPGSLSQPATMTLDYGLFTDSQPNNRELLPSDMNESLPPELGVPFWAPRRLGIPADIPSTINLDAGRESSQPPINVRRLPSPPPQDGIAPGLVLPREKEGAHHSSKGAFSCGLLTMGRGPRPLPSAPPTPSTFYSDWLPKYTSSPELTLPSDLGSPCSSELPYPSNSIPSSPSTQESTHAPRSEELFRERDWNSSGRETPNSVHVPETYLSLASDTYGLPDRRPPSARLRTGSDLITFSPRASLSSPPQNHNDEFAVDREIDLSATVERQLFVTATTDQHATSTSDRPAHCDTLTFTNDNPLTIPESLIRRASTAEAAIIASPTLHLPPEEFEDGAFLDNDGRDATEIRSQDIDTFHVSLLEHIQLNHLEPRGAINSSTPPRCDIHLPDTALNTPDGDGLVYAASQIRLTSWNEKMEDMLYSVPSGSNAGKGPHSIPQQPNPVTLNTFEPEIESVVDKGPEDPYDAGRFEPWVRAWLENEAAAESTGNSSKPGPPRAGASWERHATPSTIHALVVPVIPATDNPLEARASSKGRPSLSLELPRPVKSLAAVPTGICLTGLVERLNESPITTGGYSDVYKGLLSDRTGQICQRVAIKALRPVNLRADRAQMDQMKKRMGREMQIWGPLDHPNIVPLCGYTTDGDAFALVSPWCDHGDVLGYLKRHPFVDRQRLVQQVAAGLAYLHNRTPPVIHGDLKSGNVLINALGDAGLCDFGVSRLLQDSSSGYTSSNAGRGTMRWNAPELLDNPEQTLASDVWAFAALCLEILTGRIPFCKSATLSMVVREITQGALPGNRDDYPELPANNKFWDVLESCWKIDPKARPSMAELSEWISRMDVFEAVDSEDLGPG